MTNTPVGKLEKKGGFHEKQNILKLFTSLMGLQ